MSKDFRGAKTALAFIKWVRQLHMTDHSCTS